MAVAYKVAGNSPRSSMGIDFNSPHNPAPAYKKPKPVLIIEGFWPRYETTLYDVSVGEHRRIFWGNTALTAYMVAKRLEQDIIISDRRKLWK